MIGGVVLFGYEVEKVFEEFYFFCMSKYVDCLKVYYVEYLEFI